MDRRRPPGTEEGWYALHDLRRIDWDAWREAPDRTRDRAVEEGIDYLESHVALADAEEGGSAVFSIVGHKADLLILHLRPTLEHLDRAERRFESTALAAVTERASSYVSVTEVSGYMHEDLTEGLEAVEDEGMRNYMQQRIYPEIPDADHVCFYPMDKRRTPEQNWYDLPFEERAEHMSAHGDIGREYAGKVTQIITGSVGLDDHEWGVTLFADDPTDIKHLLYEMRFDPSSSRYADFGTFYVGRRFPPADLGALLEGEAVPTDRAAGSEDGGRRTGDAADASDGSHGGPPSGEPSHDVVDADEFLDGAADVDAGLEATDAGYGLLFESDADPDDLADEVEELADNFDHYDTHVRTTVEAGDETTAVVSLWANERAANTASGFLADLPGVDAGIGANLQSPADGDADRPEGGSTGDEGDHQGGRRGTGDGRGDTGDRRGDTETADESGGGRPTPGDATHEEIDARDFQRRVHPFGVQLDDHPEAGYALLVTSSADAEDLADEVDGLRSDFEHYDTHVLTTVRANAGETAVVSLWANERAANTASGFLADLPGAGPGIGARLDGGAGASGASGDAEPAGGDAETHGTPGDDDIRGELEDMDIYAGQPHGEDVYAMVLYSEADAETLREELDDLRERFEHYDTHVKSAVYADADGDRSAVVSIWETREAADTAGEFLSELPDVVARAGESSNFGTMGMFYTVKPERREDFVETFEEVGDALAEMEGHIDTRLMVNADDENDMFIASQWREKDDAMAFFRSEAFRDTVRWGREVLADRPRHVFLA